MKLNSWILIIFLFLSNGTLLAQGQINLEAYNPISPYDHGDKRGNTDQSKVEDEYKTDILKMLKHYTGTSDDKDCFRIKEVASCKLAKQLYVEMGSYKLYLCRDLNLFFGMSEIVPMNEYYVPFQKVETSQTPYDTAYLTKDEVDPFLGKTEELLYEGVEDAIGAEFDRLKEVATNNQLGIDPDAVTEAKDTIDGMMPDIKTKLQEVPFPLRIRNSFTGNGRFMEMHLMPTGFDREEKNREERFKDVWIHQGAINSWIPEKPPIPIWYSEFPEHVIVNRFSELARRFPELDAMMKARGAMDNCLPVKYGAGTSDKIFQGDLEPLVGDDQKCLPWMYGPMMSVPFNFDKDTVYATQAATKRDWMTIKLALILGKQLGAYNPQGGSGTFHELQDRTEGNHKRDILQFLDERRNLVKQGCFSDGEFYLPNIKGADYGPANINVEGERFVSAHYRYVRGCPVCYLPFNTDLEQILF